MDGPSSAPASDDSAPFPLDPVTASVLRRREKRRRDALAESGPVTVGCGEMDEYVLLGGLDRGSVVGLSAEDESVGLRIAMQAVARTLVRGDARATPQRAMIVTTQPVPVVLPVLRDATRIQLSEMGVEGANMTQELRGCLERAVISRVFDLEGLWEVLEDLDLAASNDVPPADPATRPPKVRDDALDAPRARPSEPLRAATPPERKPARVEVADSEDEGDFSTASSSPLSSAPASTPGGQSPQPRPIEPIAQQQQPPASEQPRPATTTAPLPASALPNMIVVTHFSAILATLFARRDTRAAHTALHLLSSHMRHLSRTLPSSPLIMLLNSTSSSPQPEAGRRHAAAAGAPPPRPPSERPLDPTLRSIFNPPPVGLPGYRHGAASRRNKPSYGLVFAQLLDVHLLCTRVPRDPEDAERLYAPVPAPVGAEEAPPVRYAWVVEVLLDEVGTWGAPKRRFREQRWGAVDVVGGRVVDAFAPPTPEAPRVYGEVRLAAGFGGPRV